MEVREGGDRAGVYLEMAKEHYAWDRHHEAQRSTICSIIIVFGGLLLSAAELSDQAAFNKQILGSIIIVVGIFGIVFVYKQYERMKYHNAIYQGYRALIGRELDIDFQIEKEILVNNQRYTKIRSFFKNVSLHWYWAFLMLLVALTGLYVVVGVPGS